MLLRILQNKRNYQQERMFPAEEGSDLCHRLVLHGRAVCSARTKPDCERCVLSGLCPREGVKE